ncbi:MAG: TIGR03618 family F420-dependent PPOX class oxidoreductase [Chloroflexota bacterium]
MKPGAEFMDLLERPIVAGFATLRPSGAPQAHPMWFVWEPDEEVLRLTHTSERHNYQYVQRDARVALLIIDPDFPYRYLQVRGRVSDIQKDPEGALYQRLQLRYRGTSSEVADRAVRVALTIQPSAFVGRNPRR